MRYFIGFLITVGLIILLIVLLFGGHGKPKARVTPKSLESYASTDAQVSMLIDGPINASQHEQVQVTVNNESVTYENLTGYNGNVATTQTFSNTEASYDAFLHALAQAGFTSGNTSKALSDEQGYCPTGNRYVFELTQDDKTLERFWATSCGKPKTYLGNQNLTVTLFQRQVPNYERLTQGILL
jgi:hypothetical protein